MKFARIVVIILLMFAFNLYADVFKLKNGEIIEGMPVSEDANGIMVKVKYGTVKIDRKTIVPIDVKPAGESRETESKNKTPAEKPGISIEKIHSGRFAGKDLLRGIYKWLGNQTDKKTGLLESYNPTVDVFLQRQAATYDQALAGLSFLISGDIKKADDLLTFYKSKWKGDGFSNFYFCPTGNPGLEGIAHLGPNMWVALLGLQYDRVTKGSQYEKLSSDIVKWAMGLSHYKGGTAMSNRDEGRAPWTEIVSTENNIDYYAVLNILEERVKDSVFKEKIQQEKSEIIDFFKKTVYDKKSGGIFRGYHKGVVDREYALDTVSWLVSAVGIDELRRWRIDVERLKMFVEKKFLVSDSGIKGFDFTDKKGAFKARRKRMISVEWTLAVVNMYCIYRNYYYKLFTEQTVLGNTKKAKELKMRTDICGHKALFYLKEVDKKILKSGDKGDMYSYPYATRDYWLVFFDSLWWKTPRAGPNGSPPGSVASCAWRAFAGRFNPLNNSGEME